MTSRIKCFMLWMSDCARAGRHFRLDTGGCEWRGGAWSLSAERRVLRPERKICVTSTEDTSSKHMTAKRHGNVPSFFVDPVEVSGVQLSFHVVSSNWTSLTSGGEAARSNVKQEERAFVCSRKLLWSRIWVYLQKTASETGKNEQQTQTTDYKKSRKTNTSAVEELHPAQCCDLRCWFRSHVCRIPRDATSQMWNTFSTKCENGVNWNEGYIFWNKQRQTNSSIYVCVCPHFYTPFPCCSADPPLLGPSPNSRPSGSRHKGPSCWKILMTRKQYPKRRKHHTPK